MSIKDAIRERRSVKSFVKNRPIDAETLIAIFESATFAPSGFNLQPWRFIRVQNYQEKEKIYACAFEQEQIRQAPEILICCGDRHVFSPEYVESVIELGTKLGSMGGEHADFLRSSIPSFEKFHPSYDSVEAWTNRQVMIAVTHMMLCATSLGISSCTMEGFVSKPIKDAFNIPAQWDICCLLALGFSTEERKFGGRFSVDKLFFQGKLP